MLGSLDRLLTSLVQPVKISDSEGIASEDRRIAPRAWASDRVGIEWIDDDGELRIMLARARDFSESGLSVLVNASFEIGATLWVTRESEKPVKAVVRHVKEQGTVWLLGLVLVTVDRRRIDRIPVTGLGAVTWLSDAGLPQECVATVTNANDFGLGIESAYRIPIGTVVTLAGGEMQCTASICFCNPLEDGSYSLGLHFVGRSAYVHNRGILGAELI